MLLLHCCNNQIVISEIQVLNICPLLWWLFGVLNEMLINDVRDIEEMQYISVNQI